MPRNRPVKKPTLGLALSGGGAKGAFQVGALDFLVNEKGLDFRVVAGVSTGALQAVLTAQGEVGRLREIWEGIRSGDDIYRKRIGGVVGGLFGADSIYSNAPLEEKIRRHVDPAKIRESGRKLRIGVTSLQTGEYRTVKESDRSLRKWVLASTAIPVFFEPVEEGGEQFVDGGIRDITPLGAVLGEKPDACLVLLASPLGMDRRPKPFPNLMKIGIRAVDIMTNEIYRNDLAEAEWINRFLARRKDIGKDPQLARYRIVPIYTLAPKRLVIDTLDFDPRHIRAAIAQGRQQAEKEWPAIRKTLRL